MRWSETTTKARWKINTSGLSNVHISIPHAKDELQLSLAQVLAIQSVRGFFMARRVRNLEIMPDVWTASKVNRRCCPFEHGYVNVWNGQVKQFNTILRPPVAVLIHLLVLCSRLKLFPLQYCIGGYKSHVRGNFHERIFRVDVTWTWKEFRLIKVQVSWLHYSLLICCCVPRIYYRTCVLHLTATAVTKAKHILYVITVNLWNDTQRQSNKHENYY